MLNNPKGRRNNEFKNWLFKKVNTHNDYLIKNILDDYLNHILNWILKNNNIIWNNLVDGNGLFYLTPLNEYQINKLSQEHSIYMLKNGRINIAGINENNINYIVDKISNL